MHLFKLFKCYSNHFLISLSISDFEILARLFLSWYAVVPGPPFLRSLPFPTAATCTRSGRGIPSVRRLERKVRYPTTSQGRKARHGNGGVARHEWNSCEPREPPRRRREGNVRCADAVPPPSTVGSRLVRQSGRGEARSRLFLWQTRDCLLWNKREACDVGRSIICSVPLLQG